MHRACTLRVRSDSTGSFARIRETRSYANLFLLDPDVNHGSFGACPRPVFERYQAWQLELEREPVNFQ
ncbi:MAG TPA: hypothetical protein VIL98_16165 [Gaiellaceae bacterium]